MSDPIELPAELPFPTGRALPPVPDVLSAAPLSTDTTGGWCPFATRHGTPNFWPGHTDRTAAVDHVTEAGWSSVVGWFKNPASQRSAHFQIRKDGTIDQFVSINDSAWANGASWQGDHWIDPQGHTIRPPWPAMATNHTNPNRRTISKEHEGDTRTPWTAAQREADTKLNRWLATQYPSLAPYVAGRTLIRHGDISPVTKPNCPGPLVDLTERAAAANGVPPPTSDPLKAELLPGPLGTTIRCSREAAAFYTLRGGFALFGYPLKDEYASVGSNQQLCSILVCERVTIKNVPGATPTHLALLAEAKDRKWI